MPFLHNARQLLSPNFDQRPENQLIDLLVIHNISLPPGEFSGDYIEDFFCNQLDCSLHPYFKQIEKLRVSAHILIKRNGDVVQFVDFDQRAWHAGVSTWNNRDKCNDFSIGIELEGTDDVPFADEQYQALVETTLQIQALYPMIENHHIVGHSDIAPGRKTDPGPCFDWNRFRQAIITAQNACQTRVENSQAQTKHKASQRS